MAKVKMDREILETLIKDHMPGTVSSFTWKKDHTVEFEYEIPRNDLKEELISSMKKWKFDSPSGD